MLCVSAHRLKAVGYLWWVWGLENTARVSRSHGQVSRGIGWGIISTDHVMVGAGNDAVVEGRWLWVNCGLTVGSHSACGLGPLYRSENKFDMYLLYSNTRIKYYDTT